MSERISIGDIEAFNDVLNLMSEQSDEFDLEHATALRSALEATKKHLDETRGLIDARITQLMDGATTREIEGGPKVKVKPTTKWRPNHSKIRTLIVNRSLYDEDGERLALPADVAERAIAITYALFVAPKAEPKTDGLKMLGVTKDDVCDEETIGSKVQVTGG